MTNPDPIKQWLEDEEFQKWASYIKDQYGVDKFLAHLCHTAHSARSRCVYCKKFIYLDAGIIGGGVPDWETCRGDFGCDDSPETNSDGTGGHLPQRQQ